MWWWACRWWRWTHEETSQKIKGYGQRASSVSYRVYGSQEEVFPGESLLQKELQRVRTNSQYNISKTISSTCLNLGWKKNTETASLTTRRWKSSLKLCRHKFVDHLASVKCTSRNNQCWPLALIPSTLCRSYRWRSSEIFKNLLRQMGKTEAKRRSYIPKNWTDDDCCRVFGPVNVDWNLNYVNPNLRHLELFKTYWLMYVIQFDGCNSISMNSWKNYLLRIHILIWIDGDVGLDPASAANLALISIWFGASETMWGCWNHSFHFTFSLEHALPA